MSVRYGIAEWYGEPFDRMGSERRRELAAHALRLTGAPSPICPFQRGGVHCKKKGGVCSIRQYGDHGASFDRLGEPVGPPAITCPLRFEQEAIIVRWLAEIVGFDDPHVAREVPFMTNPDTRRSAGRIDLVVASDSAATEWHALEIQAVYFSGPGMVTDFQILSGDGGSLPPAPSEVRRPDWRSSSAKRLMPQLETKVPTLRQWGKKVAVAVDSTFFNELGGASSNASQDLNEGDVIWLVPRMGEGGVLERHHWEVLTMEASSEKLLSADRIRRHGFEDTLRAKLRPLL